MMPLPRASSRCQRAGHDHLAGVSVIIVLAVDIDIEHHHVALHQIGAQKPGLRQIGKAEERR